MHRNSTEDVICPNCNNIQTELNLNSNDKFAWQCKKCQAIIEGNELHILQDQARFCFPRGGGGNVCTGFGGLAGEVHHIVHKK